MLIEDCVGDAGSCEVEVEELDLTGAEPPKATTFASPRANTDEATPHEVENSTRKCSSKHTEEMNAKKDNSLCGKEDRFPHECDVALKVMTAASLPPTHTTDAKYKSSTKKH